MILIGFCFFSVLIAAYYDITMASVMFVLIFTGLEWLVAIVGAFLLVITIISLIPSKHDED